VDLLLAGYLALTGGLALASFTAVGTALAAAHVVAVWGLIGPLAGVGLPDLPDPAADGGATAARGERAVAHLLRFVRVSYPVLLTPFLYTELDLLNQLHVQGYLDPTVESWEEALFGAQLSVVWAERQPWRWLSELMHLGYFSYYLLIPISAVVVYRRGGQGDLHRFTMVTGLAFFLCYVAFVVFPVTGPRYLYDQLQGTPARALLFDAVHAVAEGGSSKGTAFPSSHVAATVAAWLACRRVARRWYWTAAPFVLLLTLGTVYGRFHYAVDALAGVFVALAAWKLAPALTRRISPGDRGRSRG
jgi:membrane-associated phospholipid phosphatase